MAEEAATTTTETSATTETVTTQNEGIVAETVETSALGGAGETTTEKPSESQQETAVAKTGEGEKTADTVKVEVPETYELSVPEGFSLKPEHVELATPVFKDLGLSNDQANKLMPVAAQFVKSAVEDAFTQASLDYAAQRKTAFEAAKNEIGPQAWGEHIHLAGKVFDTFGAPKGSPLRESLEAGKWDNDPNMVRFFAKIGKAIGEDSGFGRGGGAVKKTDAELFYGSKDGVSRN